MNYKQEFENTMVELLKKAWNEGKTEGIRRAEAEYNKGYADGQADTPFTDTQRAEELAYERGLNDAWECARKIGNNSWTGLTHEIGFKNLDSSINASWDCVMKYSASEAVEKIKEWEEKQKKTERSCSTCADSDKECNDHNLHCDYSCWTPKQDDTEIKNNGIYECSCGYGWDKTDIANVRFHFCPNCGKAVEEKKQDDTEIRVDDEVISQITGTKGVVLNINDDIARVMFPNITVRFIHIDNLKKTGRHYDIGSILEQMQEGMQEE